MDLIYPYRNDPKIGNRTLIYSLRSVQKHLTGIDRVFIIGDNPNLKYIFHIPKEDVLGAAMNIFYKVLTAANHPDISEEFMVMSDDHFMIKSGPAELYPVYANNTLEQLLITQANAYKVILQNTIRLLKGKNKQTKNYNIHCPARYEKSRIKELAELYPVPAGNMGFVLKSLYFNHFEIPAQFELKDCKIKGDYDHQRITEKINGRDCFSTGKENEYPKILSYLEMLYPEKSKYE